MEAYRDCIKQSPIECANNLMDDWDHKHLPNPIQLPNKIDVVEWLWFLEKCTRQTCCINGAAASGPPSGMLD